MFSTEFSKELTRKLEKLKKKDRELFEASLRKIKEIESDPSGHKPLRYDMKGYFRVHVMKSFVLVFKVEPQSKIITFEDLDHHDRIYKT